MNRSNVSLPEAVMITIYMQNMNQPGQKGNPHIQALMERMEKEKAKWLYPSTSPKPVILRR